MQYNQPWGISDPNAPYINGDATIAQAGSIPPAASIEFPQREIVNFITASGLAPTNADLTQLAKAVQSGQVIFGVDGGTVNQLVITPNPTVTQLVQGMVFVVLANNTNTGPSTLKVSALPPVGIVHQSARTGQLTAYDITAMSMQAFCYDGTFFQIVWSSRQPGTPVYLTGPRQYYVNGSTGSDSYDGLYATFQPGTIHGPFATLQMAANQIPLWNLNGWNIAISVADGTYTWFSQPRCNGAGQVNWTGNVSSPANVVVNGINRSACILNNIGCITTFEGFKFQCSGSMAGDGMCGVNAYGAGTIAVLGDVEFGACGGAHISSQQGALVTNNVPGCTWKISGGCVGSPYMPGCFIFCYVNGSFIINSGGGPSIVISTPIALAGGFCYSFNNSFLNLNYAGLTGAANVTGQRYLCEYNSTVMTGASANPSYYPGTVAGAVSNGGYYV